MPNHLADGTLTDLSDYFQSLCFCLLSPYVDVRLLSLRLKPQAFFALNRFIKLLLMLNNQSLKVENRCLFALSGT